MKIVMVGLAAIVLGLSGCATVQPQIQYVHIPSDQSMLALNKIAEHAEHTSEVVSEVQQARAESTISLSGAKQARLAMTAVPRGWGKKTNVIYQGPFNRLVFNLAKRTNYLYYTEGTVPANIPTVTVDAMNKSYKQILNQIIPQINSDIAISVNGKTRSVIVTYPKEG